MTNPSECIFELFIAERADSNLLLDAYQLVQITAPELVGEKGVHVADGHGREFKCVVRDQRDLKWNDSCSFIASFGSYVYNYSISRAT